MAGISGIFKDPDPGILFNGRVKIAWHIIYWLLVLLFYTFFFGHQSGNYLQTFLFVIMLLPITIGTTYFFFYVLIPKYLEKRRYWRFLLFSLYTIIVSLYLTTLVVFSLVFRFIYGSHNYLDHTVMDLYYLIVGIYFTIILAIAAKLLELWYKKQQSLQLAEKARLEAELKMLKAQIHPHFLFNTLNNIYALALKKSDEAPEMIVKLSEILDYLLYECDLVEVPLEKEVTLINNYISLEKIRYGDRLDLDFTIEGDTGMAKLAPMILLPFVENSFKHGASEMRENARIKIYLEVKENELLFSIENNLRTEQAEKQENKPGGIGLENVRKRLEMTYPDSYELIIEKKDVFVVKLILRAAAN